MNAPHTYPHYPLSHGQQALWFIYREAPDNTAYNMALPLQFSAAINPETLQQAVQQLLERHPTLCTRFFERNGTPYQQQSVVEIDNYWQKMEVSGWNDVELMAQVKHISQQPFTLEQSVFRVTLFVGAEMGTVLLLTLHHIAGDAASLTVLGRELLQIYVALANNKTPVLPPVTEHYVSYVHWEKALLDSAKGQRMAAYWQKRLAGEVPILQLPTDFPRPPIQTFNGASFRFELSPKLTANLTALAKTHQTTLFTLLLSIYQILLHRYSRQSDIWVGVPTSTPRNQPEFTNMVGYLVNPMVVRTQFSTPNPPTFSELIKQTGQQVLTSLYHQPYPFTHLIDQLQPQRDSAYPPLVQVMFAYERNDLIPRYFSAAGHSAQRRDVAQMEGQFDLSLTWSEGETGEPLSGVLSYNRDLFAPHTIARLATHLQTLLISAAHDAEQSIYQLSLLTEAEKNQLLQWCQTETLYPKNQTMIDLFEQQVEQTPDNVAVVFGNASLTYQQLNTKANQLAHHLLNLQTDNDSLLTDNCFIAIAVERSLDLIIGLLSILKVGGAYVPIDTDYPTVRIQHMLTDSAASIVLTHSALKPQLPLDELAQTCAIICVDEVDFTSQATDNPKIKRQPDDLAYVIYTSGSTGKPKGVCIPQTAVIRLVKNTHYQRFSPTECFAQASNTSFDAATYEIWGALLNGAKLMYVPKSVLLNPPEFKTYFQEKAITSLFVTTALFNQIAQQQPDAFSGLNYLLFGGEQVDPQWVAKVLNTQPPQNILHVYGPTESTTFATWYPVTHVEPNAYTIPIGKPLANTEVYIVDTQYQLLPPGVPGELCIAGAGLAQLYLNRPALTAEKFIEVDIFGETKRIYRTGDLARWLPDGNIEYISRIDNQVKLRGFRIELGEIETILSQHPAVQEVVVILYKADAEKHLVAYLTTQSTANDLVAEIRTFLKSRLPDYMVPSYFVILDKLPLTPNGKIDRQALPAPVVEATLSAKPVTPTEAMLANLWATLLKRDVINRHDNFFELGGHSLLATQLIARIRDSFQVELPVRVVFEQPILAELAQAITAATDTLRLPAIEAQPADAPKVCSFAQQRLWFLDQFEQGNSATYNIPWALRLVGKVDIAALRRSLQWMVERHESLRMCFPAAGRVQVSDYAGDTILRVLDGVELTPEHYLEPFDLAQGPLFKATLCVQRDNASTLLLNMHHIISDGWSMGVLMRDLQHAYSALVHGEQPSLPPLTIQYSDYAAWQRNWLQGEVLQQQLTYWQQQLAGIPALLELPTDKPRPPQQSNQGMRYLHTLSPELSKNLLHLSQQQGVSLFMTLLSVFYILLARYSRQDDICVGSPIANRTHSQTEEMVGFFVNTLVLRGQLQAQQSFLALLHATRQTCLAAYAYQDIPFEMLVEQLQPTRSMSYSPLFQVMFSLQNNAAIERHLAELSMQTVSIDYPIAKFDLTLDMEDSGEALHCVWEYATDLFVEASIARMAGHFEMLLTAIVANPAQVISQLPMLTPAEQQQLQTWNATAADYPIHSVVDLFEQQAAKTPTSIAVVFADKQLTYQQLNTKANQLAHYLLQQQNSTEQRLIALAVTRSLDMLVSVLGILKAGCAYVPIDPSYPAARIQHTLTDSAASLLLTQTHLKTQLAELTPHCPIIYLETIDFATQATENPAIPHHASDAAYVIYTSGSTGKSKGVCISHANLSNAYYGWLSAYRLDTLHAHLQMASFAFDVFTGDWVRALGSGAKLVLCPRDYLLEPEKLYTLIQAQQIDCAEFVPSVLRSLWLYLQKTAQKLDMSLLIAGSELWYWHEYATLTACCTPTTRLVSSYGVSEATIDSSYFETTQLVRNSDAAVPIGKPFGNVRLWIVDAQQQPLPPGIAGELCIAGAGLAQGYLNRAALSAEKFITSNIFGKTERIYRTGDLARWLPDGNIEYLGRIDHQVKLRGFRIELGEIESLIAQYQAVTEVVVNLSTVDNNKYLVAYLTTESHSHDFVPELKTFLKSRLPDYMLPSYFMLLETLPLTPNGKVDRQALPAPQITNVVTAKPATPTEVLLANLWLSVLNCTAVNRNDNFFELGGHSLLATQLLTCIRDDFQIELPVRSIFEYPRLSELAAAIDTATKTTLLPRIEPQAADAPKILSFAQQRLWFLNQFEDNNTATYNMPEGYRLVGTLNIEALQQSLHWLVERHASLRTCFPAVEGQAQVQILDALPALPIHDWRHLSAAAQKVAVEKHFNHFALVPFDLHHGPLFKAELLLLDADEALVLLNLHHIISDGWSSSIFIRDWQHAYRAFAQGEQPCLPPLEIQYSDFAVWQRAGLQGAVLEQQLAYWRQQLAGIPERLTLPTDKPRPPQQSYQGTHYFYALPAALTQKLLQLSQQQGVSLFMTLLSAFYILLARYSRQNDIGVGSPIANRTQAQIEDLIGFFVNTLVLRGQIDPQQRFCDFLHATRKTCLTAYAHQDIPFEMLVEQLQPTRSMSHSPLFQVMLVLQNNAYTELTLPDLDITPSMPDFPIAKFDLTLFVEEHGDHLQCAWEYATDLFAAATIARMAVHFEHLLSALVDNPNQIISRLPMLTAVEMQQLQAWNATTVNYPNQHKTIADLFEQQVATTPTNIAVSFEGKQLTYQQLNAKANQLAQHLLSLPHSSDNCLIAIAVERCIDMLVGLLGILKIGAAYVPIDPTYPAARIQYMLTNSAAPVLLTQTTLSKSLPLNELSHACQVVYLDQPDFDAQSTANPPIKRHIEDLAYVIYTSGSTGQPKGVALPQAALVNLLHWQAQQPGLDQAAKTLQFTTLSFDVSFQEIFSTFLSGGQLVLVDSDTRRDAHALVKYLQQQQIERLYVPFVMLQHLAEELAAAKTQGLHLHNIITAGEQLRITPELRSVFNQYPNCRLHNHYGPSESHVVTAFTLPANPAEWDTLPPIGAPIANNRIYILDAQQQLQPLGVPGELCIAGVNLARGYLNQPELSAEKFIEVELFGQTERIYQTGDLARWLPDGNVEYLGRIDHQVKIRGFRIELGEIETLLTEHPDVKEAVANIIETAGNKVLVVYLTSLASQVSVDEMRLWLKARLPDYMVPSHFIVLEKLPLTPNGKVDRRVLAALPIDSVPSHHFVAPRTDNEQRLAEIWATILNVEQVGIHDNFFALGGHSLLATRLMARVLKAFGVTLSVRQLFEAPTVAESVELIEASLKTQQQVDSSEGREEIEF